MFGKGSKIYGIAKGKCPRCHEGEMFQNRNPYDLKHMTEINSECSVCGQTFEPEPNFYYGAMYVSYAYTVAIFVASYVISSLILDLSIGYVIGITVGSLILLSPFVFRLSRITWLHINVKYKKDAIKQ
ncbi:DUF983 domain-containing protein [Phaeocystidibacter marisrubri]|uniref:DUF983 domain-containing protein n=1 Tax=Phaeocystidibacter marisrubri TaxID=1577780 RepID=A0A6L3ZG14_9FLAO|nr:DUF983 domain-containing protein [Phaeocystidibacter marisrubri]KAB2816851.1 DUF983 domain-containing protein [Phaeocystidibacter marisrubri]GGH77881.1 hypothetical protein GCM10011318_28320 [Phaeocystidibacter marisrubri]